ncbi:RDD family protein [Actinomadura rugatobispora]|uniref:RDD family protein n=1 Tax=Actinomadura rugatobispora TaxID=1994 RepID=A0ABW1AEL1_9ACTN|nr:RDD family protein [Actinomadura rugatobispora]
MTQLVTGEAVALDIRVARLASRGCALLLDLFFQMMILNLALYIVGMTTLIADEAWAVGLSILTVAAVLVGYPCAFETLSRGRTLGKLAVGLRVVADDGGPIRFRQALVRALAGFLEFFVLYGAPALLTSLFNRRGKRLGDVFAGTVVIQERIPHSAMHGPVAVMPPQLAEWGRTLEVSMLSDELAMTARQYLARFWELRPEVRDELGRRIAAQVAEVVSPPPPPGVRPEIFISAVLAERRRREEWRLWQRQARRMRKLGVAWPNTGQAAAPVPVMAMAGGPPAAPVRQGPPAPPPFSAPVPGQPRFLPPPNYGAGPYQQVLTAPPPGQYGPPTGGWPQQGAYNTAPPPPEQR